MPVAPMTPAKKKPNKSAQAQAQQPQAPAPPPNYLGYVQPLQKPRVLPTADTIAQQNAGYAAETNLPYALKQHRKPFMPFSAGQLALAVPGIATADTNRQSFGPAQGFFDAITRGHDTLAMDREGTSLARILADLDRTNWQHKQNEMSQMASLYGNLFGGLFGMVQ